MERENRGQGPPERYFHVSIAGNRLNVLHVLDEGARLSVSLGDMKPGDDRAMDLLRTFTNMGVTSEEYRTAMPTHSRLHALC
jgi:hypothetical protein